MKKKKHKKPKKKHLMIRKFLKLLKNPISSQLLNEMIRKNCLKKACIKNRNYIQKKFLI